MVRQKLVNIIRLGKITDQSRDDMHMEVSQLFIVVCAIFIFLEVYSRVVGVEIALQRLRYELTVEASSKTSGVSYCA